MPNIPISPENSADELDRIARILTVDGGGRVDPLPDMERVQYRERLDEILQDSVTLAVVQCISHQTKLFLSGYIEGVPELKKLHAYLTSSIA